MPRKLPPGCIEDRDRHGNARVYYRPTKKHKKVRLRGTPWTPEFMSAYEAAKTGTAASDPKAIAPGTWRWACVRYFEESTDYRQLDPSTARKRRAILESTYDEPLAPGSERFFRNMPLARMTADSIEVLRDRKLDAPAMANGRVKAIRAVFKFACRKKHPDGRPYAPHNPAREVSHIRTGSSGWHTWTPDEVLQFQAHHVLGTKARLFLDLLLYTGQRRSDAIRFGRQHVRAGKLAFTQHKGRKRKPKRLTLPVLPILQKTLDASPCGALTYLENDWGRPFTDDGIGNKMRTWCNAAGLPHCTAHGVRKAGATMAAMNGATSHMLMSIFGWSTLQQAEVYTRAADQVRLAGSSMHLIERRKEAAT